MGGIVAISLGWFGLGFIIVEIMNSSNVIDYKLNATPIAALISLTYLFFQLALKFFKRKSSLVLHENKKYHIIKTVYQILYFIIGVACLISIPFIWWGVIKKLAISANE